uniref:FAD-dependent monooxygenase n=2 Tax=Yoonia sp. TaxID=2212373 RepID=UPI00404840E3
MNKPRQTVAIVGAGIGGLTAALAFARHGAEVFVLEQAPALTEVGAGLQITPNGGRVLQALGLSDAAARAGIAADAVVPKDAMSGRDVTRFDLTAQTPRYRFFHRASLQGLLADGAEAAGVTVHLGVQAHGMDVQGVMQTSKGPMHADVVVGADGIHSKLRAYCEPDAQQATFTGQVAWRGVVPTRETPAEAHIWMAPHRHVVTYPLDNGLLNVVAVQERSAWAAEGWSHGDDPQNLRAAFADCAPAVQEILAQIDRPLLWGLFRHPVVAQWTRGPVALLGDAAHPTLPFLAQGANLAIEDAYVLARCCAQEADVPQAFARYQALRRDRVVRALAAASANARNYHLSGLGRHVAFAGLKTLGAVAPDAFIKRLGWLYDHDVTA